jgi:hypothetical protein
MLAMGFCVKASSRNAFRFTRCFPSRAASHEYRSVHSHRPVARDACPAPWRSIRLAEHARAHAAPGSRSSGRGLRDHRRLQAVAGLAKRGSKGNPRRSGARLRHRDEGAALVRQRRTQERGAHGRGACRRVAHGRRQTDPGRHRQIARPQDDVGQAPPHPCAPPRPGARLPARRRQPVDDRRVAALRLRRPDAEGSGRRGHAPRPQDPRGAGFRGDVPHRAGRHYSRGAPARSALRPAALSRPGRLAAGHHGCRDRRALRCRGERTRGACPRRFRGLVRCRASSARGPPAASRRSHCRSRQPNKGGMS